MAIMNRLLIITLLVLSPYLEACPWHADPNYDPFAEALASGGTARTSDDYKEVKITISDRIKGASQEFWPKGEVLTLPTVYGWNCDFSHYVQGFPLRSLECVRGNQRYFTDIPCHPYQGQPASEVWDIKDARGVALASIELNCAQYVQNIPAKKTVDAATPETITIGGDPWCPYNCEENSAFRGYMIDVAEAAFAPHGIKVEYKNINWARAIKHARSNIITAIVGASKADAPDFVFPSEALGDSGTCFYTLPKRGWQYTSVESLKQVVVGIENGYAYVPELDAYFQDKNNAARVEAVSGSEGLRTNFNKILAGRIDTTVTDDNVGDYAIRQLNLTGKIIQAGCASSDKIHIAFSPQHPKAKEFAKILADAVVAMRKSGKLGEILSKYGISEGVNKAHK